MSPNTLIPRIGVYAGTFDPLTMGHVDIIERSLQFCDEIHVLVAQGAEKKTWFTAAERVAMVRDVFVHHKKITVVHHLGLTADYAAKISAKMLIRGLRSGSDYDYEMSMAQMNHHIAPKVETIFLPTRAEYCHISSTLVKDIAKHRGDLSSLVPPQVEQRLMSQANA